MVPIGTEFVRRELNIIPARATVTFLFDHQPNAQMTDEELEQLAPWNEDVKAEIQKPQYSSLSFGIIVGIQGATKSFMIFSTSGSSILSAA